MRSRSRTSAAPTWPQPMTRMFICVTSWLCFAVGLLCWPQAVWRQQAAQSIGSVYHICPEGENSPRIKIFVQAVREYDILVQL